MSERTRLEPLEPLEPELAKLFAEEQVPTPPRAAATRVLGRVATSIALASDAHDASGLLRGLGRRAIGLATTTFVLGAAVGAGVVLALRAAPVATVTHVEVPLASATLPPPAETPPSVPSALANDDEPSTSSPSPSVPAQPRRRGQPQPQPQSTDADSLGAERAIIDEARSLLSTGDARGALQRLAEHARRFPKARLEEEREALAIQALVNMGDHAQARGRADTFRARWPSSVYLPAVDATIRSIP